MYYVINFVFSTGKQPYREAINFVSYIHVVYNSYNDKTTHIYMRTDYLRHLANIIDIQWSRPVGRGWGQLPIKLASLVQTPKQCSELVTFRLQTNIMQYSR